MVVFVQAVIIEEHSYWLPVSAIPIYECFSHLLASKMVYAGREQLQPFFTSGKWTAAVVEAVDSIGGGVCRIATTLAADAALRAGNGVFKEQEPFYDRNLVKPVNGCCYYRHL